MYGSSYVHPDPGSPSHHQGEHLLVRCCVATTIKIERCKRKPNARLDTFALRARGKHRRRCEPGPPRNVPARSPPGRRRAVPKGSRELGVRTLARALDRPRRLPGRRLRAGGVRRSPKITRVDLRETRRYPCEVREEPREFGVAHVTILQSVCDHGCEGDREFL